MAELFSGEREAPDQPVAAARATDALLIHGQKQFRRAAGRLDQGGTTAVLQRLELPQGAAQGRRGHGARCGLRFEVGLLEAPDVRLHPHRQPRAGGAEPDGGGIGLGK